MSEQHRTVVDNIIGQILNGSAVVPSSFTSLRRVATWSIACADYAYQDLKSEKTIALIFFTGDADTTKQNAIRTLNHFDSVLVCFDSNDLSDAYAFEQMLKLENLSSLPIGTIAFDGKGSISVLRHCVLSKTEAIKRSTKEQKSYWCWWRDSSHFEVATLLKLSLLHDNEEGDIYSTKVYPEFFGMMISGKTRMWNGKPRVKSYSEASYKSEKQNYKIPMCQLGLWDAETGHITSKGQFLLKIIDAFGEDSTEYLYTLAKMILVDGKHLDLIKDLEEFQLNNKSLIPESSSEFFILFEDYMTQRNSVGTRKPSAIKTGAKKSYVRDEPKLWNKLGIIKLQGPGRYYKSFFGIEFNWEKINKILLFSIPGGY